MASLWEKMTALYGHKWTSAHGLEDDGTWARVLGDITPVQLATGLERCVTDRDDIWPPTAPEFRMMCMGRSCDSELDAIEAQQRRQADYTLKLPKKPTDEEMAYGKEQGAKLRAMFK